MARSLTSPLLLDQFALGNRHTLTELRVPPSFVGQTLREVDLRSRFGVTLLAVKRTEDLVISPSATHRFAADDLLVAIGTNEQITRLSGLV